MTRLSSHKQAPLPLENAPEFVVIDPSIVTASSALDSIKVQGGTRLEGEIPISGAKNAALKHLCAAMLTSWNPCSL